MTSALGLTTAQSVAAGAASRFAANRACLATSLMDGAAYPALAGAWLRSAALLSAIRERLASADLPSAVSTVVVSGSLGRMEAVDASDCDLFVVLDERASHADGARREVVDRVWQALADMGLERPDPHGVFAHAATAVELCDRRLRGRIDEAPATFGKRFQLLLDCQPVYGDAAYQRLLALAVAYYVDAPSIGAADRAWGYLLDDLARYAHALRANYLWDAVDRPLKWRLQNLKLVFSRTLMFAGLVFVVGELSCDQASREPNGFGAAERLTMQLALTPLERLAAVYAAHGDARFALVVAAYDTFLARMGDDAFRSALAGDERRGSQTLAIGPAAAANRTPAHLAQHGVFQDLAAAGRAMRRELLRFVIDRRGVWSDDLYERMLLG